MSWPKPLPLRQQNQQTPTMQRPTPRTTPEPTQQPARLQTTVAPPTPAAAAQTQSQADGPTLQRIATAQPPMPPTTSTGTAPPLRTTTAQPGSTTSAQPPQGNATSAQPTPLPKALAKPRLQPFSMQAIQQTMMQAALQPSVQCNTELPAAAALPMQGAVQPPMPADMQPPPRPSTSAHAAAASRQAALQPPPETKNQVPAALHASLQLKLSKTQSISQPDRRTASATQTPQPTCELQMQPSTSRAALQSTMNPMMLEMPPTFDQPMMQASTSKAALQAALKQASAFKGPQQVKLNLRAPTPSEQMPAPVQPRAQISHEPRPLLESPLTLPNSKVIPPAMMALLQAMHDRAQAAAQAPVPEEERPPDETGQMQLNGEIADIMRSFGDSEKPREESVALVAQILRQQLRGIFNEAAIRSLRLRDDNSPTQSDFEFLMRDQPTKLERFRRHLRQMRDLKKSAGQLEELESLYFGEEDEPESPLDEVRMRRVLRADRISKLLTSEEYFKFDEEHLPPDMIIPTSTMHMMAYFAFDTIAAVVDFCLLGRQHSGTRWQEPYYPGEMRPPRGSEARLAISVNEIHEAMRRFRQAAPMRVGFYRSHEIDQRRSFLAL